MRCCDRFATLPILASVVAVCLLGASSGSREFLLGVGEGDAIPKRIVLEAQSVLLRRLRSAGDEATVTVLPNARLCVSVKGATAVPLARLLTSRGAISLRVVPSGPTYNLAESPISRVRIGSDAIGQDSISLTMSDPKSFRKFTSAHLNRVLGVYLDARLIGESTIVMTVDRDVEIAGNGIRDPNWRLLEAVVDSGPLAARIAILRAACD